MTVAHDAFDTLAGAIALGEATPLERATFTSHAATCGTCAASSDAFAAVRDAIVASREDERWSPSVDARVRARIGDERNRRTRATFGAFHWAIAFSLALNVAFFSGFVGRLATKLHETGEPSSAVLATMWVTEHKRHRPSADIAAVVVAARATRPTRTIVARRALGSLREPTAATDEIPDVLAGLDVDAHAPRRVASVTAMRCKNAAHDECPVGRVVDAP